MKRIYLFKSVIICCLSGFMLISSGCNKSYGTNNTSVDDAPSAQNSYQMNYLRIVGKWKNVSVSDFNWEKDYGVNAGPQNGSYIDYIINADGSGTCVKYVATSEPGNIYTIFQRSSGFFKAKKNSSLEGYYEFTYCPTSGIIELTKNGITIKTKLTGNQLYQKNDPYSARNFFPSYNIVQPSSGSYTDPHHYTYYTYTDKNGTLVTTSNGNAKVTSMVDVL